MSEEVLINVTSRETRVAMIENGILQEVIIERTSKRGLVSNIYKGRVCRVLPGMQAAFVEIGLERAAFLHLSDIINTHLQAGIEPANQIDELLHEGKTLLVQVIKDPLGTKGARLTAQISIPSRYVVLLPYSPNMIGISTRIESPEERQRLKDIALQHTGMVEQDKLTETKDNNETVMMHAVSSPKTSVESGKNYGFILRTVAEEAEENFLCADMDFLCRLWTDIQEKETKVKPCSLVYRDLSLVLRTIRDLSGSSIDKIKIDSRDTHHQVVNFAKKFIPDLVPHIEHYTGERPLFDLYSIDDEINKALEPKVPLKSGGYLVIDQTEAMTTIDVNTGGYVGSRNLEETIFRTNLEAAQAIARQLRLRNLGGIIILDFIDMKDEEHQRQVLRTLEKCLERDRTKSYISEISQLGLVEMTRKRTRESLEHTLCRTCPTCRGRGTIKTAETVCYDIFRDIVRFTQQFETQKFLVLASQKIVDTMLEDESNSVLELEESIGCSIRFQVETSYSQELYDIIPSG
ncbi:ribonuclease G and E [Beggiatoa sp. PS]|nr:ribonuclease G and E [Beggiatoa sp. PS]